MNCKQNTVQFVQMSSTIWGMPKKPVVNLTRLKKLMQEKKWEIGELAIYSGVKYNTVYSLFVGRRPNSNIETLKKIADALEVSTDYLLGESDDKSPPAGTLPQPIRQLLQIAGELPAMRQEELARIAGALADLERERAERPVSIETMHAMLEASEKFGSGVTAEDLLAALRILLRDLPPRWIIDLQISQETADHPAQSE